MVSLLHNHIKTQRDGQCAIQFSENVEKWLICFAIAEKRRGGQSAIQLHKNAERRLVCYTIFRKPRQMVNLLCNCRKTQIDGQSALQLQKNAERLLVCYTIFRKRRKMVSLLCNCRKTQRFVQSAKQLQRKDRKTTEDEHRKWSLESKIYTVQKEPVETKIRVNKCIKLRRIIGNELFLT